MLDFRLGDNASNTASSRGLWVESFEDIGYPAKRLERIEIPNRDGFITAGDSSYAGITRVAHCYLPKATNATPAYVFSWIVNNSKVFFSDEDAAHAGSANGGNLFRYYSITEELRARSLGSPLGYEMDITFTCQPFRYWETPTSVTVTYAEGTGDGKVVHNTGNAYNAPLVRVGRASQSGGAAWIAWGSNASERIEFSNLLYPLYIDSELREVYYEDSTNGNANAITSLQKFPSIPALGQRLIKFGGNVAQLQISMRERNQ